MEKIAFVIDSTVYLPENVIKENDIKVVSLNVIDGDKTLKEVEVDNDFVFKRQNENARLTTSQPSPAEFLETYQQCFKEGYTKVLALVLSKAISGTYQSAILAKSMLDNPEDVHVLDTEMAAYGNELIALEVIALLRKEKPLKEIIKKAENIIANTHLYFTVENLFSLQKGGRLSKVQAVIGTVLKVKPVIKMIEGKLKLTHKERTFKKLYPYFIEEVKNDPNMSEKKTLHVRLIERKSLDNLEELKTLLEATFNKVVITTTGYIGPVFSIHVGDKGFGLAWYFE